jgi:hypothetical protein
MIGGTKASPTRLRRASQRSCQALSLAAALTIAGPVAAQEATPAEIPRTQEATSPSEPTLDPEQSAARVLLWVRRIIAEDRERLAALSTRGKLLDKRLEGASERFARLDEELTALRRAAESGTAEDPEALESAWERAREEVDLLLGSRQAVDQDVRILERKLEKEEEALQVVTTGGLPQPEMRRKPEATPSAAPSPATDVPLPGLPSLPAAPAAPGTAPSARPEEETFDWRVAASEREVAGHLAAVRGAERRALLLEQLLALDREEAELARATAEASRRQQALFEREAAELEAQLAGLRASDAPLREQTSLERRLREQRRLAAEVAQAAAGEIGAWIASNASSGSPPRGRGSRQCSRFWRSSGWPGAASPDGWSTAW